MLKDLFLLKYTELKEKVTDFILKYNQKFIQRRATYSFGDIRQIGVKILILAVVMFIFSQNIWTYALGKTTAKYNPVAPMLLQEERTLRDYAKQIEFTSSYIVMLRRMYGDPSQWDQKLHIQYDYLFSLKDQYIMQYNDLVIKYNKQTSNSINLLSTTGRATLITSEANK